MIFLMLLLVMLTLEQSPGHRQGCVTTLSVITGQTTIVVYEASIVGMLV